MRWEIKPPLNGISLTDICTKNYLNWTFTVKIIFDGSVNCFFETVYIALAGIKASSRYRQRSYMACEWVPMAVRLVASCCSLCTYLLTYLHTYRSRQVSGYLLPMTSRTRRLRMLPMSGGKDDRLLLRSDNTLSLLHWLICTRTNNTYTLIHTTHISKLSW